MLWAVIDNDFILVKNPLVFTQFVEVHDSDNTLFVPSHNCVGHIHEKLTSILKIKTFEMKH